MCISISIMAHIKFDGHALPRIGVYWYSPLNTEPGVSLFYHPI